MDKLNKTLGKHPETMEPGPQVFPEESSDLVCVGRPASERPWHKRRDLSDCCDCGVVTQSPGFVMVRLIF